MTDKDSSNFIERFTVRLPDGMRDTIAERARKNGRSMNSEIIQIIEDAIKRDAIIDSALSQNIDTRLDENKVSELELLQEKIIAIQRSENDLLKEKLELLRRMAENGQ